MSNKEKDEDIIEMTAETHAELTAELNERKEETRDEIAAEISEARALGDLRENHAYTVAMERRERNESRISELESLLKSVKVVAKSSSSKVVTIGKTAKIKNLSTGTSREVTLTGSEETEAADPRSGKVSIDSPLGMALHNSKVGEKVEVETPNGVVEYEIVGLV